MEALLILYERMLGLTEWWTASSVKYKKYYDENVKTNFHKAVDELDRAIVMWISELAKMKVTGTGACDSDVKFHHI